MESNILKYIWKHSRPQQMWMLVVILASMPTYFLSLELPKRIVNGPIQGIGFENPGDTNTYLEFWLPFSDWLSGQPIKLFSGFELERTDFLFALSGTFLVLVIINGLFKMYINSYKGRIGERILRRLRFELFDRVLRYPLSRFRRTKPSEIASMIKDEVEPMGEFIGDAYTQPLFLGGQALTGLAFIFLQHVGLGLVTLAVVAFQAWFIPLLRRRLIVLGKERQVEARILAGKIGEAVENIRDIHVNDTSNYQRSMVSAIMGKLYFIRYEQYQRKFFIKFLNNFLMQFLAFIFYAVGGYLAIRGTIDLGQLLGVIVAYKDLPDPIRALIDYDQRRLVVEARYEQIVEQFQANDLEPEDRYIPDGQEIPHLSNGYELSNLGVVDETGTTILEGITITIDRGEHLAIIGSINSGSRQFSQLLAGLMRPTSGLAKLNDRQLTDLPEYVTGRRISYIEGDTYFPQANIYDTLTQVLKNEPKRALEKSKVETPQMKRRLKEAELTGNSLLDIEADWIDYERVGFKSRKELDEHIEQIIEFVELKPDIESLGLRGLVDPQERPKLAEKLVKARHIFRDHLQELGLQAIVEPFDVDQYNSQATVAENLMFGTAASSSFEPNNLASNPEVRKELSKTENLHKALFEMGIEIATTTVELFGDLSEDNVFFDQLNYMSSDELPEYKALLKRIEKQATQDIVYDDETQILRLALSYVENRNRLGLLSDKFKQQIVSARHSLREYLDGRAIDMVEFYDPEKYNTKSSVLDNVLLGRIDTSVADGHERVTSAIRKLLEEMGLASEIFTVGLDFNIGSGGKRLSETQRQKLHLARAIIKKPDVLIINHALNSLDIITQKALLDKILARSRQGLLDEVTIIWNLMNAQFANEFKRVLVFSKNTLVGDGAPDQLQEDNEYYRQLVQAYKQ